MKKLYILIATAAAAFLALTAAGLIKKSNIVLLPSNESIVAYLSGYGWSTDINNISSVSITIPEIFNSTYANYNQIQKNQGFNLDTYRGEQVTLITCPVTNYPDSSDVTIHLITNGTTLIGADISGKGNNGFIGPVNRH